MCVGALYEQRHFRLILTSTGVDDALFWTVILVLLLQIVVAATAPLIMQLRSHDLNERSILKRRSVIIASIVLCAAALSFLRLYMQLGSLVSWGRDGKTK